METQIYLFLRIFLLENYAFLLQQKELWQQ